MKKSLIASLAMAAVLFGCSQKPTDADVATVLTENFPAHLKDVAKIEKTVVEVATSGDETVVKFKSTLKLEQPLYKQEDFEAVAKSSGFEAAQFAVISSMFAELSQSNQSTLSKDIEFALRKPVFIAELSPIGTTGDWYGSFKSKKVVDKWVSTDFKTEVMPKMEGQARASFSDDVLQTKESSSIFTKLKDEQASAIARLKTAKDLEKKDAEIAIARAAEQRANEAKDRALEAIAKIQRQMPVKAEFRRALLGGTEVLRLQAARPITVRLDVSRGLQNFSRELTLTPGRVLEIGHVEGWGFKSGDKVMLSNSSTDSFQFIAP